MSAEHRLGIDTHAFYDSVDPNREPLPIAHTSEYLDLEQYRDSRFIVMPFVSEHNLYVIKAVKENPRLLGAMLWVNPNSSAPNASEYDDIETVESLLQKDHVVGVKMHPVFIRLPMNDKSYFPYYDAAQRNGVPVLLHASASKKELDSPEMGQEISERFPDLKIIFAHLGGLDAKWIEPAVRLALENPNIYLNTTSLPQLGRGPRTDINTGIKSRLTDLSEDEVRSQLREAIRLLGILLSSDPQKVVAGTDIGYELPENCDLAYGIREAGEEIERMVLTENPYRLFGKNLKPLV